MPTSSKSPAADARFQYASGSLIPTADSGPIAFPGPLQENGKPSPKLLRFFIQKCLLTSEQERMSAEDWNNLGCAYAQLAKPNFKSAQSALSRAQALTLNEELLQIIEHNLEVLRGAVQEAAQAGTRSASKPVKASPATGKRLTVRKAERQESEPRKRKKGLIPLPDVRLWEAYKRLVPLGVRSLTHLATGGRSSSGPKTASGGRTTKASTTHSGKKPGSKGPRR
jgi:hypothetical protein